MNTQQQIKSILAISLASVLMITSPLLQAGERESLEQLRSTTLNLIDMLVSEGVLSKSKADILKKGRRNSSFGVCGIRYFCRNDSIE